MEKQYEYTGEIKKLKSILSSPIQYTLPISESEIPLNPLLGKILTLKFADEIYCLGCQKKTKKSYNQGYCFVCSQKLARCDFCILKPEKCHYDLGTCREPEWGEAHCMIPHIVYLANTSDLKVGVTRESQIPTRWIDQGALEALPMFRVSTRYAAGLIEVILAKQVKDKTDWRKMLRGTKAVVDLVSKKNELFKIFEKEFDGIADKVKNAKIEYLGTGAEAVTEFQYPVLEYPIKISSLNFNKTPEISGKLLGIKGQYLIFDAGVLNVRNLGGYRVEVGVV